MEKLFVYGTLREPAVQLRVIGRLIAGVPDSLQGFRKTEVRFPSGTYPMLRRAADTVVDGLVLEVNAAELERIDHYETRAYQRVRVTLVSGSSAWVYCAPETD